MHNLPDLVLLNLVFYPHLGNENLVPLWNLNLGLAFAQVYLTQHNVVKVTLQSTSFFFSHHLHEDASEQYMSAKTLSR
jgi:hypothetical protein